MSGQYLDFNGATISIRGDITTVSQAGGPYSVTTVYATNLFNLSQPINDPRTITLMTDYLFIYSQGSAFIKGTITPQNLQSTCMSNDYAQVFTFVQNPTSLPLSESDLFQNIETQYDLPSSSFADLKAIVLNNFTYTIIALDTLSISPQALIQTSRFAAYANVTVLGGTIDTSSKGCAGGQGIGKGKNANSLCTATGGAYGGFGGASAPIG